MTTELRNVSKVFTDPRSGKGLVALKDVDLAVEEGEFLCLVGASGCGKSTTLNLLAGFESPSRGEVLFRGERVRGPSPARGVVFQESSLYPWMSVLKNVMFSLQGEERQEERAMEQLRLVGLEDFAHSRPNDLSGGMKQRVAIARTLAMGPELLLMDEPFGSLGEGDEPFGSLDEQTRRKLDTEVLNLWQRERKTVVFVTHNIDEALILGTRVVLMSASPGRIEREWRIDEPWPRDLASKDMIRIKGEIISMLQACPCANGAPAAMIDLEGM